MQRTKRANHIRGADFVTHRERRRASEVGARGTCVLRRYNLSQRTDVQIVMAVVEETSGRFGGSPSVVETTVRRLHVGPANGSTTNRSQPP